MLHSWVLRVDEIAEDTAEFDKQLTNGGPLIRTKALQVLTPLLVSRIPHGFGVGLASPSKKPMSATVSGLVSAVIWPLFIRYSLTTSLFSLNLQNTLKITR